MCIPLLILDPLTVCVGPAQKDRVTQISTNQYEGYTSLPPRGSSARQPSQNPTQRNEFLTQDFKSVSRLIQLCRPRRNRCAFAIRHRPSGLTMKGWRIVTGENPPLEGRLCTLVLKTSLCSLHLAPGMTTFLEAYVGASGWVAAKLAQLQTPCHHISRYAASSKQVCHRRLAHPRSSFSFLTGPAATEQQAQLRLQYEPAGDMVLQFEATTSFEDYRCR